MASLSQFIKSKKPGVILTDIPEDEFRELVRLHVQHLAEKRKLVAKEKAMLLKIEKDERKRIKASESRKPIHKAEEPKKYKSYRLRANAKQIKFELPQELFFILLDMDCSYCGGAGGGIDRKNSKEGYTKENSVPCCNKCNIMKFTFTVDEFINHIKKIYTHTHNA